MIEVIFWLSSGSLFGWVVYMLWDNYRIRRADNLHRRVLLIILNQRPVM